MVNFYTAYFPSAIWKALTPKMPLWRHREFINRSLYCWPRAVYCGFTHYVDYWVCDYCGTLNGSSATRTSATRMRRRRYLTHADETPGVLAPGLSGAASAAEADEASTEPADAGRPGATASRSDAQHRLAVRQLL